MHLTANRAMLEHLKKGGLLKGDVEDMIKVSGENYQLDQHVNAKIGRIPKQLDWLKVDRPKIDTGNK